MLPNPHFVVFYNGIEQQAEKDVLEQGIEQGRILQLIKLVESGDITVERAAQKSNMTVEEFKEKMRGSYV